MTAQIDRNEGQKMVADGAQPVGMLPAKEYAVEHIPSAVLVSAIRPATCCDSTVLALAGEQAGAAAEAVKGKPQKGDEQCLRKSSRTSGV